MALKQLTISHLYPDELNIYGDRGNVMVLRTRLEWRGYKVKVDEVHPGTKYDFTQSDIIFGGGGQDKGQEIVASDLMQRRREITAAINDGVTLLSICGTYQLLGNKFVTINGKELPGIGIFNTQTHGSKKRLIGNVVISTSYGELVGFENHSGKTLLADSQQPLGKVIKGYGNDGSSGCEGAVTNNAFGSYLHGPLLPKNPDFADELLRRALTRKYGGVELEPLNDTFEHKAAYAAKKRPQ